MISWIEAHAGLAAWIQTIGTLIALGYAVFAPVFDRMRLEQVAALACRIPLRSALDAMTKAEAYFDSDVANTPQRQAHRAALESAVGQLRQMPLDKLPGGASIHLHNFTEKVAAFGARFDHADTIPRSQLAHATVACREACEALGKAIRFAPALCDAKQLRALTGAFASAADRM